METPPDDGRTLAEIKSLTTDRHPTRLGDQASIAKRREADKLARESQAKSGEAIFGGEHGLHTNSIRVASSDLAKSVDVNP